MTGQSDDIVIRAGRALLWLFMGIFIAGAALIALGLGTFLIWQTGVFGPVPETATGLRAANAPELPMAMLLALAATLMAFRFTQLLHQIVNSVAIGDPFTLENANRLQAMAILALVYQFLSAGMFFLGITVARITPLEALVSGEDLSLTPLLLSLILFILARVFKHGASMREDLEGTV